jgi:RNA polymerase primary sigma factor
MEEISKYDVLSPEEEFRLAVKVTEGNQEAITELVRGNLRFVISVAKGYASSDPVKMSDLINEGNIGLLEAAETFDPTTGFKFISYAVWHIRKNMLKYLNDNSRTVKLPHNKSMALLQMKDIESRLTNELDRYPTPEEIVEEFVKISPSMKDIKNEESTRDGLVHFLNNSALKSTALEGNSEDPEENFGPIGYINGDSQGTDHLINQSDRGELLELLLSQLNSRERDIIIRRFGIGMVAPESRISVANRLEVTPETIRHWEIKIIKKLARLSRVSGLKMELIDES